MRRFLLSVVFLLSSIAWIHPVSSWAVSSELACEVMSVEGAVDLLKEDGSKILLKEGELVKDQGVIETHAGTADISFDKDWNNIVRVESESKVKIASSWPSKVEIYRGSVFAKLGKLPKESTFEVQTPTAIAAVRGTEYRAVFKDGETLVYNFSSSQVFVYSVDGLGNKAGESTILAQSQKTNVPGVGLPAKPPQVMTFSESQEGRLMQSAVEEKVKRVIESGRLGKIQSVAALEAMEFPSDSRNPKGESRVVDSRRREFKSNSTASKS